MSTLLEDIIKLRNEVEEEKHHDYEEYKNAKEIGAHNQESKMSMAYICHRSYVHKLDELIERHSGGS